VGGQPPYSLTEVDIHEPHDWHGPTAHRMSEALSRTVAWYSLAGKSLRR